MKPKYLLFAVFLCLLSFSVIVWATEAKDGAVTITPEDKQAAQKALSGLPDTDDTLAELPKAEPPGEIEEEQADTIVIKFTQGVNPSDVFKEADIEVVKIEQANVGLPIAAPVNTIEGAVSGAEAALSEQDATLSLGEHSDSWYWQMNRNYQEVKKEDSQEEAFDLYYNITLAKGLTAKDAIIKLNSNPNVEYVMPASLMDF